MKKFLILIVSAVFLVAFAMPAAAQSEFNLYGQVHLDTMVTKTDNPAATGLRDTSPLTWDLSNWSRFGAIIKVDDKIGGMIEWRSFGGNYLANDLKQSVWTGTYDMGFATLRVGRMWNISFNPPPVFMVDSVGSPIANVQAPEIRLEKIKLGPVTLAIAATEAGELGITGNTATWAAPVTEQVMPKLETRADVKFGPVGFSLLGGYYSYDIYSNATTTSLKKDIDTNYWGAIGTFNSGPISLWGSWMSFKNADQWSNAAATIGAAFDATDTNIVDADRDVWQFRASYTLNPMITFNFIYGESKYTQSIGGFNNEDPQKGWAVTVPFTITKNFEIRLEYSYLDNEDRLINGVRTEETEVTKYGARWIIYF